MKVKELIARLQSENPESMVIVAGYEGGFDEVKHVNQKRIALNVNSAWYYGDHERIDHYRVEDAVRKFDEVDAVQIS